MKYSYFAMGFNGIKEGGNKHKYIIDYYNTQIKPLPRGYKATYCDSWCAIFVSFVLHNCKAINAPYECSVFQMYKKAERNHQIVTTPQPDDIVIYDWFADGTVDHVGIITNIEGNNIYVIEGNKNNAVGVRKILKTSPEIACYIRVSQEEDNKQSYYEDIVNRVIRGDFGNYPKRKHMIEALGLNYKMIQNMVDLEMKKRKGKND